MRRIASVLAAGALCAAGVTASAPAHASPAHASPAHASPATGEIPYTAQLISQLPGDPAFRFSYEFALGDTTPQRAMALVRDCLSCVLPLGGAPETFPAEGAIVAFTVPAITDADDFTSRVTTWDATLPLTPGFQLAATGDNIAGDGSVVAFGFFKDRAGRNLLSVDGRVMNHLGEHADTYRAATAAIWAEFAANLAGVAR